MRCFTENLSRRQICNFTDNRVILVKDARERYIRDRKAKFHCSFFDNIALLRQKMRRLSTNRFIAFALYGLTAPDYDRSCTCP